MPDKATLAAAESPAIVQRLQSAVPEALAMLAGMELNLFLISPARAQKAPRSHWLRAWKRIDCLGCFTR